MIGQIKNKWLRRAAIIAYAPPFFALMIVIDFIGAMFAFGGAVIVNRTNDWELIRKSW